jgi:uncharacterized membrane protein YhaH (DUF805 family)
MEGDMSSQFEEKGKYWFPAKKYGWGWGMPSSWQGWVTLIIYLGSLALNTYIFPPEEKLASFLFLTIVLSVLLIVVCLIKGEPPRWRWGKE